MYREQGPHSFIIPTDELLFIFVNVGPVDLGQSFPGLPKLEAFIAEYCHHKGIPHIDNWQFYVAFICFRNAAIRQGVYKRFLQGQICIFFNLVY